MVRQVSSGSRFRVVRCRVGDQSFAVDLEQVCGFHRSDRLERAVGAGGRVGQLQTEQGGIPVYALADLLGWPRSSFQRMAHIILTKTEHGTWGLLVDDVSRVVHLEGEVVRPFPVLLQQWPEIPSRWVLLDEEQPRLVLVPAMLRPGGGPEPTGSAGPFREQDVDPCFGSGSDTRGQLLLFSLPELGAGERPLSAAVSLALVEEVVELPAFTPIPRCPGFLLGLTKWRSRPLPVVDLAHRLGLPPTPRDRGSRLLVLRGGQLGWIGIVVRVGLRVLSLPVKHEPSHRVLPLQQSLLRGAVELGGETVLVPSLFRALQGTGSKLDPLSVRSSPENA